MTGTWSGLQVGPLVVANDESMSKGKDQFQLYNVFTFCSDYTDLIVLELDDICECV